MGTIKYSEGFDHIIKSENKKSFRIFDEQLILLEKNNNYSNEYSIRLSNLYDEELFKYLEKLSDSNLNIFFKDMDFSQLPEEKITFMYGIYINNKSYNITPEFIENLFNEGKSIEINVDYIDGKDNYYNFLNINLSFEKGVRGLFSSTSSKIHITEKSSFDRFNFVKWLANKNFAGIIDGQKETYEEI